ncbi:MAG: flagellum-specific ATP synthase FliI, partial [Terracidiphilus sp.]
MTALLERYFSRLECRQPWRGRGHVLESVGQTIESAGPPVSVGECCEIEDHAGRTHRAEVIGFRGSNVLSMPIDSTEGIRYGDLVWAQGAKPEIEVGPALLGRVLNAVGAPIDAGRPPATATTLPLDGTVRLPLDRAAISEPLGTGIRALDAMLT